MKQIKEYVIKIGIGTSEIDGREYAVLMLDHIDLDSLLRTAAIMELIKPTLSPLKDQHPRFFGEDTEVMGIDDELAVSVAKVKKIINIKVESRSTLSEILAKLDEAAIEKAKKNLPSAFFEFKHQKIFSQQATMIYSGMYKDSYRGFINNYKEKGFYFIVLGNEGSAIPGVQLVKEDLELN
ncbi:hypothetical protein JOC37_000343 [Desulfohalotomaculum tongense]|uniref:hypothetical protein n=1 Tax=Desulforadius tongensis TaxID=1216062 RepID=UPI00195DA3A5|nr:hypothetical protein [Desulforadius tongensis]MBM7853971.1 hypothetical protein [Desulforadius tongensis]